MPLHIDRVESDFDVLPDTPAAGGTAKPPAIASATHSELRERLRPIVLEILEEELERHRRELG